MAARRIEKFVMLNKRTRWFNSSRVKIQHVCMLALGVSMFDLDFGVHIDSVNRPIQRNSVVSGHVSHGRTSLPL